MEASYGQNRIGERRNLRSRKAAMRFEERRALHDSWIAGDRSNCAVLKRKGRRIWLFIREESAEQLEKRNGWLAGGEDDFRLEGLGSEELAVEERALTWRGAKNW